MVNVDGSVKLSLCNQSATPTYNNHDVSLSVSGPEGEHEAFVSADH